MFFYLYYDLQYFAIHRNNSKRQGNESLYLCCEGRKNIVWLPSPQTNGLYSMIESLDRSPHHRRGSFKTLHLNEDEFFSHTLKMMMVMMISCVHSQKTSILQSNYVCTSTKSGKYFKNFKSIECQEKFEEFEYLTGVACLILFSLLLAGILLETLKPFIAKGCQVTEMATKCWDQQWTTFKILSISDSSDQDE